MSDRYDLPKECDCGKHWSTQNSEPVYHMVREWNFCPYCGERLDGGSE